MLKLINLLVPQGSIYMFGGMKADGNITRELWRLDTQTLKWSLMPSKRAARVGGGRGGGGRSGNGRRNRQGRKERNRRNNRNGKNKDDEANVNGREWGDEEEEEEKEAQKEENKEKEQEEEEKEKEGQGHQRKNRGGGCSHAPGPCAPIRCVGHASVVVQKGKKNVMLVIFGHSSVYGYLNTIQEYDLGKVLMLFPCLDSS